MDLDSVIWNALLAFMSRVQRPNSVTFALPESPTLPGPGYVNRYSPWDPSSLRFAREKTLQTAPAEPTAPFVPYPLRFVPILSPRVTMGALAGWPLESRFR